MNREQKAQIVDDIRARLEETPFLALTDFQGSTVAQMDALRRACEEKGVSYQVVKNTLSKRAIEGTDLEGLREHFTGNIGLLIAGEDPIAAAKLLKAQLKDNPNLELRAGFFEGDVLDEKKTLAVAELPSREELLVTLLRTLQEGPRQILGVIRGPARDLLYLLSNYAKKLEEQG